LNRNDEITLEHVARPPQIVIERWRREYNTLWPHSWLGYQPPAPATHGAKQLTLEQPQLMQ
jgi:transposase InsO family protein